MFEFGDDYSIKPIDLSHTNFKPKKIKFKSLNGVLLTGNIRDSKRGGIMRDEIEITRLI
jgi:hypothetical protein